MESCWAGRELLELKRFECNRKVLRNAPGCHTWDIFVQLLFHVGLEALPPCVGVVYALKTSSPRDLFGAAFT
jgi:hypothetical protein